MAPKNEQNMVIFKAKIANNLPLMRFLVGIFMSKAGPHVAVDGMKIFPLRLERENAVVFISAFKEGVYQNPYFHGIKC